MSDARQVLHTTHVNLQGVAEAPNVQILVEQSEGLDFGPVTWGSQHSLPIVLINRGRAKVPIRLSISATDKSTWQCYSFDPYASPGTSAVGSTLANYTLPPPDKVSFIFSGFLKKCKDFLA